MPDICETPAEIDTLPIYKSNDSFKFSDHSGKVILLSFMSLYCSHCWSWVQRWIDLKSQYAAANVEIVVVVFNLLNPGQDAVTDDMIDSQAATNGYPNFQPNFTLLRDSFGTVSSVYRSGFTGPSIGFPYQYLIARSYLIANKWHSDSTSNGELVSFNSQDYSDVENFIKHRIADLLLDRSRWNTVLVLDLSDTMNDEETLAGVTKSKVAFMRDAVDVCLRVWKDYSLCQDKVGLVTFSSKASSGGVLLPILKDDNAQSISDQIAAATASGCTAMGAGIATGIDILETDPIVAGDAQKRHMIVFTDGIQNRNPMVWRTDECVNVCHWEPQIRHVDPAEITLMDGFLCDSSGDGGESGYAGSLPRIIHGNPMQTAIHTIGIGVPDAYQWVLTVVSNETAGVSHLDTDVWPNLEEFFVDSMMQVSRGFSLGLVAKASGQLAGSMAVYEQGFHLNRSVRSATIVLSWVDETAPLTFELWKDGELLSLQNKQTLQRAASVTTLPFPLYQPPRSFVAGRPVVQELTHASALALPSVARLRASGELVEAEGDYIIRIRHMFPGTTQAVPFHLMVLADDHNVEVEPWLPKQIFFTDERIPLHVVVTEHGSPVENVFSVTASVSHPTMSFSNLYADHCRQVAGKVSLKGQDVLARRYQSVVKDMLKNKNVVQSLRTRATEAVRLEPAPYSGHKAGRASGHYEAQYSGTRVPGHYRIEAVARGATPTAGVFERIVSRTVLVLPHPDLEQSNVQVSRGSKEQTLVITMTPADRHGNLLGPGFGTQVQLVLDEEPCGKLKDKEDGSYQIDVDLRGKRSKATRATLWIAGEKVFSGSLAKLKELSKK